MIVWVYTKQRKLRFIKFKKIHNNDNLNGILNITKLSINASSYFNGIIIMFFRKVIIILIEISDEYLSLNDLKQNE